MKTPYTVFQPSTTFAYRLCLWNLKWQYAYFITTNGWMRKNSIQSNGLKFKKKWSWKCTQHGRMNCPLYYPTLIYMLWKPHSLLWPPPTTFAYQLLFMKLEITIRTTNNLSNHLSKKNNGCTCGDNDIKRQHQQQPQLWIFVFHVLQPPYLCSFVIGMSYWHLKSSNIKALIQFI